MERSERIHEGDAVTRSEVADEIGLQVERVGRVSVVPGDTRFFQFWVRDNAGGAPGHNFSDGLRVTFCP